MADDSPSRHLARVGDLSAGRGSDARGLNRRHRGGAAVEGRELDFERLAVGVDTDHRPQSPVSRRPLGSEAVRTPSSCSLIMTNALSLDRLLPIGVRQHPDRCQTVRTICSRPFCLRFF